METVECGVMRVVYVAERAGTRSPAGASLPAGAQDSEKQRPQKPSGELLQATDSGVGPPVLRRASSSLYFL